MTYHGVQLRPIADRPNPKSRPQEPKRGQTPLALILADVVRRSGVSEYRIKSTLKDKSVSRARTMYARATISDGWSLPQAATFIGKHHTTLLQAAKRRLSGRPKWRTRAHEWCCDGAGI